MPRTSGVVVCISSHVARGAVGNRGTVFALERLGFEVWAVPTIVLPHHPGHGPAEAIVADEGRFAALLRILIEDGRAANVAGIVSGYLASAEQAHAIAALVRAVKGARPDALYLCDPVIGDAHRLYVGEPVAAAIRDTLLPLADMATPNAFECAWLAGASGAVEPDLAALGARLAPRSVLVTSAPGLMRGQIGNLFVGEAETILFEHPHLATPLKGSGDLLAALMIARRLQGHDWPRAIELALASVFEVTAGTVKAGANELMLAALQDSLVHPHAPIAIRRMRSAAG